jgi:hypothetical protein
VKRYRKISLTTSAKPVGVWAGSQPWIPRAERFGLLMRTAMMAKDSSFAQIEY